VSENQGDIKIRRMVKDDLASVNDVDRSISGKGRVTTWPGSFDSYRRIYRPSAVYIAELNGEVVGFLAGYIEKEERSKSVIKRPHEASDILQEEKIGWIEMIGIRPEAWHKGIGTRLVEAFHNECKKNDAMMRIVFRRDDRELTGFFRNVGFRQPKFVTYEKSA